jgi:hypothetical protein
MKRITNKISILLATLFISFQCVTHGADAPEKVVPHELRLKAARKPYNIARYFYLTVEKENEEAFLKLYKERLTVRQHHVETGKFLWFALFKARINEFGSNYVVSVGQDSVQLEGGRRSWETPHLPAFFSADQWTETTSEMDKLRTFNGSLMVALRDYTVGDMDAPKWPEDRRDIVLNIGYMKAAPGKESLYKNVEQDVFQKVWQKRYENDPSFIGWGFHTVIANNVEGMDSDYLTTNISRSDVKLSQEESDKIWDQIRAEAGRSLKDMAVDSVDDIREIRSVTYDLVMGTDGSKQIKNQTRNSLLGTWVHKNKDGSYRKKVVSHFTEQLSFFNAEGELVEKRKPWPIRIEIIDQQPRFTVYAPDGSTWNAAINVVNGKWYEQHRAIRNGRWTESDPTVYWVYERSE